MDLNLYNSGHAEEAGIMDMRGNILHKWTCKKCNLDRIWQEWDMLRYQKTRDATTHWRRVHLYDNGDILAIYEGLLMVKLDKDSNLVWISEVGGTHHHMQVLENGNIYVLVKKGRIIPRVNKNKKVFEDYIVVLNSKGKIIKEYSLLESFENSSYGYLLNNMRREGELFHTNTLQIFDGDLSHLSPLYKKGNVLISVLYLNTIAIVDLETNQVMWALKGSENDLWIGMHEPVLLNNGDILIFDNNWAAEGVVSESKVIEFNPITKKIVWLYKGDEEHPFYSRTLGTNQRLPNGNTLITESESGRAFEVTTEGQIVWEYVNPNRTGENNELVATLFHMHRIDNDSLKWLPRKN